MIEDRCIDTVDDWFRASATWNAAHGVLVLGAGAFVDQAHAVIDWPTLDLEPNGFGPVVVNASIIVDILHPGTGWGTAYEALSWFAALRHDVSLEASPVLLRGLRCAPPQRLDDTGPLPGWWWAAWNIELTTVEQPSDLLPARPKLLLLTGGTLERIT